MSDLGAVPLGVMWALIGAAVAGVHLWLLRRALDGAEPLDPGRAGFRLASTMPLRLLAVAPVLALAARSGLVACLGLVAGSVAGRWCGVYLLRGRAPLSHRCRKQGRTRGR